MSQLVQYIYRLESGEVVIDVELNGTSEVKAFDLSTAMTGGFDGIIASVSKILREMETIPTIGFRYMVIQRGIKLEAETGIQLTNKAPASSAIAKREYGIKKGVSKLKTGLAFSALLSLAAMASEERYIWDDAFGVE